jgi:hypothetical protein
MALIGINGNMGSGKDTVGNIAQFLLHTEGVWDRKYWDDLQKRSIKGVGHNWQNYWEIKKFAGKLKLIATLLTGVPIEKWEDQEFKETYMSEDWVYSKQVMECDENNDDGFMDLPLTYREFLQKLGTEAIRDGLHTNTWVNALMCDYKPLLNYHNLKESIGEMIWGEETNQIANIQYPNWIITDTRFPNEFDAIKKKGGICIKVLRENNTVDLHASETALDSYKFDYVLNNSGTLEDLVEEVKTMLIHFKLLK